MGRLSDYVRKIDDSKYLLTKTISVEEISNSELRESASWFLNQPHKAKQAVGVLICSVVASKKPVFLLSQSIGDKLIAMHPMTGRKPFSLNANRGLTYRGFTKEIDSAIGFVLLSSCKKAKTKGVIIITDEDLLGVTGAVTEDMIVEALLTQSRNPGAKEVIDDIKSYFNETKAQVFNFSRFQEFKETRLQGIKEKSGVGSVVVPASVSVRSNTYNEIQTQDKVLSFRKPRSTNKSVDTASEVELTPSPNCADPLPILGELEMLDVETLASDDQRCFITGQLECLRNGHPLDAYTTRLINSLLSDAKKRVGQLK